MKIRRIFLALSLAVSGLTLFGCDKGGGGKKDEFIDYVHDGSVQLLQDYKGKSFWNDGIEQVTLKTHIDGDTVHFFTPSDNSKVLKARFYGIDTPESTGQIQPFGKQASNFTKEKIQNAEKNGTIVVSSPRRDYGIPSPDSTGERYVSLVWINETKKNAAKDELILLNLYIVQEGFSWVKNAAEFPEYTETFDKAVTQAEKFKKGVFSDEPDPLYNYGGFTPLSLIEIKREVIAVLEDPTHENAYDGWNVCVTGAIAGVDSNNTMYIQDFYTHEDFPDLVPEEGEYAGLNIYMGPTGAADYNFYTPGNYVQVCGTLQDSETFGFQMTNCSFKMLPQDEKDARILYYVDDGVMDPNKVLKQFDYTIEEFNEIIAAKNYDKMNCAVSCTTTLKCNRAYANTTNDEFTLYFENTRLTAYVTFSYKPYADHPGTIFDTIDEFVGKEFKVRGVFVPHKTQSGNINIQINPINSTYLECITPYEG